MSSFRLDTLDRNVLTTRKNKNGTEQTKKAVLQNALRFYSAFLNKVGLELESFLLIFSLVPPPLQFSNLGKLSQSLQHFASLFT